MKHYYLLLISSIFLGNICFAATPPSLGVNSDAEIASFAVQYPNVTELEYLSIGGEVTNLTGLNNITKVKNLTINTLQPISGLNNLVSIGNDLKIFSEFNGLNSLESVGYDSTIPSSFSFEASVSGLLNLKSVKAPIAILGAKVTSIPSFNNLLTATSLITISSTNIITINGFNKLNSLTSLSVTNNPVLYNISGFNGCLTSESLYLTDNPKLFSINVFSSLQTISSIFKLTDNPDLQTTNGFGSLTAVVRYEIANSLKLEHLPVTPLLNNIDNIILYNNPLLFDLEGLNGLTSVGRLEFNKCGLTNILALYNLTTISQDLFIRYCNSLSSLEGLNNVSPNSTFSITDNSILSTCAIKSICDRIPIARIGLSNNAPNCNSVQEVTTFCNALSTNNFIQNNDMVIYPNPTNSTLNIKTNNNTILDKLVITDLTGKIHSEQTKNTSQINVQHLANGVYILETFSGKLKSENKFIKK